MRARPIVVAAVTAVVGALLATPVAAEPGGADAAVQGGEPAPTFASYVALGDSYTAGPLVPLQTPGPLGCFRSSANYPAFLAAYLGVETFTDVSCSAARSEHMFTSQTANLPSGLPENHNAPQLLALTPETDLVTLGIGGNDFGLFGEMIDACADLAAQRPDADAPCREHFTVDGVDTKLRDARAIEGNVSEVLAAIGERSPDATVVVVNYLHILPTSGTCSAVPFAEGDYAWGTSVHRALNESLRGAAEEHGATYVDAYAASQGRDACAPRGKRWVNGATVAPNALNYHPFRSGMRAIAQTTFTRLTGEQAPLVAPTPQLLKRLPAVVDVDGLLTYVLHGGDVPEEALEQAEAQDPRRVELVGPVLDSTLGQVRSTLRSVEELLGPGR